MAFADKPTIKLGRRPLRSGGGVVEPPPPPPGEYLDIGPNGIKTWPVSSTPLVYQSLRPSGVDIYGNGTPVDHGPMPAATKIARVEADFAGNLQNALNAAFAGTGPYAGAGVNDVCYVVLPPGNTATYSWNGGFYVPVNVHGGWVVMCCEALATGTWPYPEFGHDIWTANPSGRGGWRHLAGTTLAKVTAMGIGSALVLQNAPGVKRFRMEGIEVTCDLTYTQSLHTSQGGSSWNSQAILFFQYDGITNFADMPRDICVSRCWVHSDEAHGCTRAIWINANYVTVCRNEITDISAYGQDSQAIALIAGSYYAFVENIAEAAGENIMAGGGSPPAGTENTGVFNPRHGVQRRNWMRKKPQWCYLTNNLTVNGVTYNYDGRNVVVKNTDEHKDGGQELAEGNLLELNWGGQGQSGFMMIFQKLADLNTDFRGVFLDGITRRFNHYRDNPPALLQLTGRVWYANTNHRRATAMTTGATTTLTYAGHGLIVGDRVSLRQKSGAQAVTYEDNLEGAVDFSTTGVTGLHGDPIEVLAVTTDTFTIDLATSGTYDPGTTDSWVYFYGMIPTPATGFEWSNNKATRLGGDSPFASLLTASADKMFQTGNWKNATIQDNSLLTGGGGGWLSLAGPAEPEVELFAFRRNVLPFTYYGIIGDLGGGKAGLDAYFPGAKQDVTNNHFDGSTANRMGLLVPGNTYDETNTAAPASDQGADLALVDAYLGPLANIP